jgi:hypothetical protein
VQNKLLLLHMTRSCKKRFWAPRVVWGSEYVEITATEAMEAEAGGKSGAHAKDTAKTFLKDLLANGPVAKLEIEEAAEANDISMRTLKRAKKNSESKLKNLASLTAGAGSCQKSRRARAGTAND